MSTKEQDFDKALTDAEQEVGGQLESVAQELNPRPEFKLGLEAQLRLNAEPLAGNTRQSTAQGAKIPLFTQAHKSTGGKVTSRRWYGFPTPQTPFAMTGLSIAVIMFVVLGLSAILGPNTPTTRDSQTSVALISPMPTVDVNGIKLSVGSQAPQLYLVDVRTNLLTSLYKLEGKPVVLNFWGTWCVPCRDELPAIEQIYARHADVQFINVSFGPKDTLAKVSDFLTKDSYTWTFAHVEQYNSNAPYGGTFDPAIAEAVMSERALASYIYMNNTIPVTYYIDSVGTIRGIDIGRKDAIALEQGIGKFTDNVTSTPITPTLSKLPIKTPTPDPTETYVQASPWLALGISIADFKASYDDPEKRPIILDVRPQYAYEQGHIKGAISFPEADVDSHVNELPRDKLIVAYCQCAEESESVAVVMKLHDSYSFSFENLKILNYDVTGRPSLGGLFNHRLMSAWEAWVYAHDQDPNGYPIEPPLSTPKPVLPPK